MSTSGDGDAEHTTSVERLPASALLPLVYDELRSLAASRLAREGRREDLMQPTSLVHAAYVRIVSDAARQESAWNGRSHFFAAAALAMRRILVERARRAGQVKRGGGWKRVSDEGLCAEDGPDRVDLLALDAALEDLNAHDPDLYQIVMLRYFAGLSVEDTASLTSHSPTTIKRRWTVGRLWLLERIERRGVSGTGPG